MSTLSKNTHTHNTTTNNNDKDNGNDDSLLRLSKGKCNFIHSKAIELANHSRWPIAILFETSKARWHLHVALELNNMNRDEPQEEPSSSSMFQMDVCGISHGAYKQLMELIWMN